MDADAQKQKARIGATKSAALMTLLASQVLALWRDMNRVEPGA
jgi:hypothetical protein